jgi:hypothetical protein
MPFIVGQVDDDGVFKHNIGNATLGREIIRKYLKRQADDELA